MSDPDFAVKFLKTMAALDDLRECLVYIGMSGNRDFEHLCEAIVRHGAVTYRDITREPQS